MTNVEMVKDDQATLNIKSKVVIGDA